MHGCACLHIWQQTFLLFCKQFLDFLKNPLLILLNFCLWVPQYILLYWNVLRYLKGSIVAHFGDFCSMPGVYENAVPNTRVYERERWNWLRDIWIVVGISVRYIFLGVLTNISESLYWLCPPSFYVFFFKIVQVPQNFVHIYTHCDPGRDFVLSSVRLVAGEILLSKDR